MKSILSLALVVGFATTGYAQENNNEVSDSETSIAVSGEQTVRASDIIAPTETPKRWSVGLDSENVKAMNGNAYDGDVEAYQAIKVGYKLQDNLSLQIASEWTQRYGYSGNSGSNEANTTFEDVSLRVTRSNLFQTGPLSWTAQARAYLPTSDYSQDINQLAQFRGYLLGGMDLTKSLSLELVISPRYYVFESGSRVAGNNDWRILNSAGLKYAINDDLAVETTLGVYSKRKVGAETAHFQDYSTSVYYTINQTFSVNAGIRAIDGAQNADKEGVDLYNPNVSEYYGILSVSL